jgi:tetratricopeptide (TPR) repeat protein
MTVDPLITEKVFQEELLREAEASARTSGSKSDLMVALGKLAAFYGSTSERALQPAIEAACLARSLNHPQLRYVLLQRVIAEASLGRQADAETGAEELIRLGPGTSPIDHLAYCQAFLVKASTAYALGDLEATEKQYRTALNKAAQFFGEDDEFTLHARQELANFLATIERYDAALDEQRTILRVGQKVYGSSNPRFADSLNKLGVIYDQLGDYVSAKAIYQQVLDYRRDALGDDHPNVAQSMYNLAELARAMQVNDAAERALSDVLALEERLRGRETFLFSLAAKNLGLLYADEGKIEKAEPLLLEAAAVADKLGPEGEDALASATLGLGLFYERFKRPTAAISWLQRALDIYRGRTGPSSPSCARVLMALANCKAQAGEADALTTAKEAAAMMLAGLGDGHWETSLVRHQLARHLAARGQWGQALETMEIAARHDDEAISKILTSSARRQISKRISQLRERLLFYLAVVNALPQTPNRARRAYDYVLRRKGIESAAARLQRDSGFVLLTGVEMELRRLRRRLLRSRLRSAGSLTDTSSALATEHIRAAIEKLETALASSVPEDRIYLHLFGKNAELVARGLPQGTVLVDFVDGVPGLHTADSFDAGDEPKLVAFVLHADEPDRISMVNLGPSAPIAQAVKHFRDCLEREPSEGGPPERGWMSAGERVRELVFDPLRASLGLAQQILIAPDGAVDRLVFETLPLEGNFLLDQFCVSYLHSGREVDWKYVVAPSSLDLDVNGSETHDAGAPLAQPTVQQVIPIDFAGGVTTAPVVVTDPDFDAPLGPGAVFLNVRDTVLPYRGPQVHFERLGATALEGARIGKRLNVVPVMGPQTIKSILAGLRSPEILHVATHGFLVPYRVRMDDDVPEEGAPELPAFYRMLSGLDDPLHRCGLAVAGANISISGSPNQRAAGEGLLWATEVLELDLRSTDLVVLSACHTGAGESRLGDGATSLRRAFKIAGAASVVSSMWTVFDDAAQELMAIFYDQLLAEQPRAQALCTAKRELRAKYPDDPFLWGAFVLEGKTLPLDRFNTLNSVQLRFPKVYEQLLAEEKERDLSAAARLFTEAKKAQNRGRYLEALKLLRRVRRMKTSKPTLVDKANYEISSIHRRSGKLKRAYDGYTRLLERGDLAAQLRLKVQFDRGTTNMMTGDFVGAIEDYTEVLLSSDTIPPEAALALVNRGWAFVVTHDVDAALEDFSSVITMSEAPPEQIAKARLNRGQIFNAAGEQAAAIADYTAVLQLAGVDDGYSSKARLLRADVLAQQGHHTAAAADLKAVLRSAGVDDQVAAEARRLLEQIEKSR